MRETRSGLRWFVVCGALGLATVASADEVTLRFAPTPGAVFASEMKIHQDGTIDMGPVGEQQFSTETTLQMTQRVSEGEANDLRVVENVIDHMGMSVYQGGNEVLSMDTASDAEPVEGQEALAMMIGKPFVIEFDELGGVRGASGFDQMFEALAEDSSPEAQQAMAVVQGSFNEDTMVQMMQMSLPVFPEGAVEIGESWQRDTEMTHPMMGTIDIDAEYTFEGLDEVAGEPCARLGVQLNMEFEFDAPVIQQMMAAMGESVEVSMDVEDIASTGSMCIAREDGVTLESTMQQEMKMTMAFSAEGQDEMNMRMALDQTIEQRTSR